MSEGEGQEPRRAAANVPGQTRTPAFRIDTNCLEHACVAPRREEALADQVGEIEIPKDSQIAGASRLILITDREGTVQLQERELAAPPRV